MSQAAAAGRRPPAPCVRPGKAGPLIGIGHTAVQVQEIGPGILLGKCLVLQILEITFGKCCLELLLTGGVESLTAYETLVQLEQYGGGADVCTVGFGYGGCRLSLKD